MNRRPPGTNASLSAVHPNMPLLSTKGAHLQIVGEIQTREYVAKDGTKKSVTEIRVHRVVRLDRASKAESTEGAAA